jgi:hypothetical protein
MLAASPHVGELERMIVAETADGRRLRSLPIWVWLALRGFSTDGYAIHPVQGEAPTSSTREQGGGSCLTVDNPARPFNKLVTWSIGGAACFVLGRVSPGRFAGWQGKDRRALHRRSFEVLEAKVDPC